MDKHHDMNSHSSHQGNKDVYTCPMHPEVISDKPGKCPKCGMDLVLKSEQEGHKEMVKTEHQKMLWTHLTITLLGVFLITNPFRFEYNSSAMNYSDIISGALLIIFSLLSINPFRFWAPWAACFVGIWLLFAPLIFWAPAQAGYINNTLIGTLVIALSVLIPGMPGMMHMMMTMPPGPETPPGWSYNPSSWLQRTPIIALGWIGFLGSQYMASYQLGYIPHAWDPFFGKGTENVLNSEVSKMWPISDAGLGATVYILEALMGYMGGSDRWRTMPWMVALFGILVIPLGATSIILIILQPVAVGAWCSMCLFTAVAMLIMIPLTMDEVVAMIQFLVKKKREGKNFWTVFWMGDTVEGGGKDDRSPSMLAAPSKTIPAMLWGVNIPWNLLLATAVGMWLMFSPSSFGFTGTFADTHHIIGALIVTFSVIAMAEVTRYVRFINILFGAGIIAASFIWGEGTSAALWNAVAAGAILIALSFPKGAIRDSYGSYDRFIK